ncbi:hypothetical protein NDU88_004583 [Pleurodeles waltl]|uniref:Uncharacterized protein n=1 Tax=Pleurodeles waltl TaxID=8319 RepID=A0AAV7SJ64_PLEWA|nr:hypothetical protein NDU88_004583 [Pleurodeles waltl]
MRWWGLGARLPSVRADPSLTEAASGSLGRCGRSGASERSPLLDREVRAPVCALEEVSSQATTFGCKHVSPRRPGTAGLERGPSKGRGVCLDMSERRTGCFTAQSFRLNTAYLKAVYRCPRHTWVAVPRYVLKCCLLGTVWCIVYIFVRVARSCK